VSIFPAENSNTANQIESKDMANLYCEEDGLVKMPGGNNDSNRASVIALLKSLTESELYGDQGGYPAVIEDYCLTHEGRRMVPEIHDADFTQLHYQLDGCFNLEFEEAL
jgi:hypothetical protein